MATKVCVLCHKEFIVKGRAASSKIVCDNCRHRKCEHCGKTFVPTVSGRNISMTRFCSYKCFGAAHKNRVRYQCPICGKIFEMRKSMKRRTCSKECKDKWVASLNRLRPKKGINKRCLVCGKIFYVYPSAHKKGHGVFCSKRCRFRYQLQKWWEDKDRRNNYLQRLRSVSKPNKAERKLGEIIEKNDFPFKYVGNGSLMIDGLNPDFAMNSGNKLIELFGGYWHAEGRKRKYGGEKKRREFFNKRGYILLVIWENELSDKELVAEKIHSFLRA